MLLGLCVVIFMTFIESLYSQCGLGYQGNPCQAVVNTPFTITYTGGDQSYVVPSSVNVLYVKLWGGGGGGSYEDANPGTLYGGGAGGFASCYLAVTPGSTLNVIVAGAGTSCTTGSSGTYSGGFGGGGAHTSGVACDGSGGGRSAIQSLGYDIITAAGIVINTHSTAISDHFIHRRRRSRNMRVILWKHMHIHNYLLRKRGRCYYYTYYNNSYLFFLLITKVAEVGL